MLLYAGASPRTLWLKELAQYRTHGSLSAGRHQVWSACRQPKFDVEDHATLTTRTINPTPFLEARAAGFTPACRACKPFHQEMLHLTVPMTSIPQPHRHLDCAYDSAAVTLHTTCKSNMIRKTSFVCDDYEILMLKSLFISCRSSCLALSLSYTGFIRSDPNVQ